MMCQQSSHWSCHTRHIRAVITASSWHHNRSDRKRQYSVAAATADRHYAVVGAGLAGLATAYHLLKQSTPGQAVHITLIDAVGIGAGGSGAAAGLLHPFTPKGKLLWKAPEAMAAALELLSVAEAAAAVSTDLPNTIAWRTGMLRPAGDIKQSQVYWKACNKPTHHQQQQQHDSDTADALLQASLRANLVDAVAASQLVPHVALPAVQAAAAAGPGDTADQQQQQRRHNKQQQQQQQQRELSGWTVASSAALHIPGGVTLHAMFYMKALWAACKMAAAARSDGSSAHLHIQQLTTLDNLHAQITGVSSEPNSNLSSDSSSSCKDNNRPPFDAVVVAAGAAVGSIAEFADQLPISLCQGYTLDMVPPDCHPNSTNESRNGSSSSRCCYEATAPSLLGSPYLASQGGQLLVVGATKQHNFTAQQAFNELGRRVHPAVLQQQQQQLPGDTCKDREAAAAAAEASEVASAASELLAGAAAAWPPVARWAVGGIRTGVRALPPRTQHGAVPLAGKWAAASADTPPARPPVWLLVGLGARGLLYHAWLGLLTAQAVLSNSEAQLPPELLAWKHKKGSAIGATTCSASISEAQ